MGVADNDVPNTSNQLRKLLKEAGLRSSGVDASRRLVMFTGRTRDWSFSVNIYNGWFHAHAYVCEVPAASGLRAELFDAMMVANQKMSLTKFGKSSGLYFEFEYRLEHLDGGTVSNLFGFAVEQVQEHYPRLFRLGTGDSVLDALEKQTAIASATEIPE